MKYSEAKLEDTVIELLQNQSFEYVKGEANLFNKQSINAYFYRFAPIFF